MARLSLFLLRMLIDSALHRRHIPVTDTKVQAKRTANKKWSSTPQKASFVVPQSPLAE